MPPKATLVQRDKPDLLGTNQHRHIDIIDIHNESTVTSLKEDVLSMLQPEEGPRRMPTLLLYSEKGLQLFEDVRYNRDVTKLYYPADVRRSHI